MAISSVVINLVSRRATVHAMKSVRKVVRAATSSAVVISSVSRVVTNSVAATSRVVTSSAVVISSAVAISRAATNSVVAMVIASIRRATIPLPSTT